jgi:hypothetical protein
MRPLPLQPLAPEAFPAEEPLVDLRFRRLLSTEAWAALPAAVRARFSKRLAGGRTIIYAGRVTETRITAAGRALTQLARLIGAPLPTRQDVDVPTVVTVTEDMATGGQIWSRLYARRDRFPQVIQSSKRFAGETGLEEHVGFGIGMSLRLAVTPTALEFHCHRYFIDLFGRRWPLPRWLAPGELVVGHHDLGAGRFAFTLDLTHPWFGLLVHQRAEYADA